MIFFCQPNISSLDLQQSLFLIFLGDFQYVPVAKKRAIIWKFIPAGLFVTFLEENPVFLWRKKKVCWDREDYLSNEKIKGLEVVFGVCRGSKTTQCRNYFINHLIDGKYPCSSFCPCLSWKTESRAPLPEAMLELDRRGWIRLVVVGLFWRLQGVVVLIVLGDFRLTFTLLTVN